MLYQDEIFIKINDMINLTRWYNFNIMFKYLIIEFIVAIIGFIAVATIIVHFVRLKNVRGGFKKIGLWLPVLVLVFAFFLGLAGNRTLKGSF